MSPRYWTTLIADTIGSDLNGVYRCGPSADILCRILMMEGHDARVCLGKANGVDHAWVYVGDDIYDPTAGQFKGEIAYEYRRTYRPDLTP